MNKPANRDELEQRYGETWATEEAEALFKFEFFFGPGIASVTRRSDEKSGYLSFWDGDEPPYERYYFNWR